MIWVLIDYSNGYWQAEGIEGVRLHEVGPGGLSYGGTGVETYQRMLDDIVELYLKPQFPGELICPMWLHTNHAKSRLHQAEKEESQRHARAA